MEIYQLSKDQRKNITIEKLAILILKILRLNLEDYKNHGYGGRVGFYHPSSKEAIHQELLNGRVPGTGAYDPDFDKKFEEAISLLKNRFLIMNDSTQRNNDYIVPTEKGWKYDLSDVTLARYDLMDLFDSLKLHPDIIKASKNSFSNGEYGSSVFMACVALKELVEHQSNVPCEKEEPNYFHTVFKGENPILKINGLQDQSDRDEQEGFRFMIVGAWKALRNPRGHSLKHKDDPEDALSCLAFLSFLAKKVENAEKE